MLTEHAKQLLEKRYYKTDEDGNIVEGFEGMCDRVASLALSDSPKLYNRIYEYLVDLKFLPNSPCLMNANTEMQYMSACNVLDVQDNMESIFDSIKNLALVNKAGSGTGFSFSELRPEGDVVGSTGGVSSGPLSFINVYDMAIDTVKQGGKRKGAGMGVLHVSHPDVFKFIKAKIELSERNRPIFNFINSLVSNKISDAELDLIRKKLLDNQYSNFNFSVAVTDKFMQAVEQDSDFELINPRNNEVWDEVKARDIWNLIIKSAYETGCPGLVFIDEINRRHPIKEEIKAVNVCGEQPLLPYESCTLGAINLAKLTRNGELCKQELFKIVKDVTRFLDILIDKNEYPLPELEEMAYKYRKIGIGVMGWHEYLIKRGIKYDSEDALVEAERMSVYIHNEAIRESQILVEEKEPFPGINETDIETPRRNAVLTTVAPTGSRSFIADTSGGIEPFFDFSYTHTDSDGKISEFKFDIENIDPELLVTAHEIDPIWHVKMQAVWQENIGSAVSKTVNLPKDATQQTVEDVYHKAHELKCKGITIYRDGSKSEQVLNNQPQVTSESSFAQISPVREDADAKRIRLKTACGTLWFIPVFDDEGRLIEIFTESKNGGCQSSIEALSRQVSLALRAGVPAEKVIEQLEDADVCKSFVSVRAKGTKELSDGYSCPSVMAKTLRNILDINGGTGKVKEEVFYVSNKTKCPDCGAKLERSSGCISCGNCGYAECG